MSKQETRFVKMEKDIENVKEKIGEQGEKINHIHDKFDKLYDFLLKGGMDNTYASKEVENIVFDLKKKFWVLILGFIGTLLSAIGTFLKLFVLR